MSNEPHSDEFFISMAILWCEAHEVNAYSTTISGAFREVAERPISEKRLRNSLKRMENHGYVSSRLIIDDKNTLKRVYKYLKRVPE